MKDECIHIAIAFDQHYLLQFYALAASAFDSNPKTSLTFHCITRDIPEKEKLLIADYLENNNSTVNFYKVDEQLISNFVTMNHWSTTVYYKIFFPLIVSEEVDRILYLDTDTLIVNSLNEWYHLDMQGYPLAVVKDMHVRKQVFSDLHEREDYFNSGVMLIDVKKWNTLKISQETFHFLSHYPERIIYVDQDALNVVLEKKYLLVSERFNYTYTHLMADASGNELKKILKNLVIIHFTLSRPWHFLCQNRFRNLYSFYLRKSPKKGEQAITDFSFSKIPAYLKIRIKEQYSDMPQPVRNAVKAMRRLIALFKITSTREVLLILFHHQVTRKLAQSYPVLQRLLIFSIQCADNRIHMSRHSKEMLLLSWQNKNKDVQLYVRKYTRDLLVFAQFFIEKEYSEQYIEPLKIKYSKKINFIVDAGANIGCSAFYFHFLFPDAKIVCIEPETSNYTLLRKNILLNNASEIIAIQKAVWNEVTQLELMQRDWSPDGFHVMKKSEPDQVISKIPTTTFPQLMQDFGYAKIDLLKMDIEGAEQTIFSDEFHLQIFLSKTERLVIEVHKEFISAQSICELLGNAHFECMTVTIKGQPDVVLAKKTNQEN